jgi:hypothetical protein
MAPGLHSLAWSVTDSGGRTEGIGSRLFWNAPGAVQPSSEDTGKNVRSMMSDELLMRTGYDLTSQLRPVGDIAAVDQAGRLELHLPGHVSRGCLVAAGRCTELPAGSTLDGGVFYWQLAPAYRGTYELRFESDGREIRVPVEVQ